MLRYMLCYMGGGDAGTLRFPLFILYANVRVCDGENERERRPTTAGLLPYYHLYLLTLFCDLFIHAALHNGCCVDPARVILLYYPFGLRAATDRRLSFHHLYTIGTTTTTREGAERQKSRCEVLTARPRACSMAYPIQPGPRSAADACRPSHAN